MTPSAALLLVASYLIGAIPFGYLVARMKGVDLFKAGSGNIGATNVGRILGRKYGVLVFVLDFLKGAGPVAAIVPLARSLDPDATDSADVLRVGAALLAFLGHLFPVYLGFRGGKGVATGAGAVFVLVPGPAALAALTWVLAALTTRYVSFASVAGVVALVIARIGGAADPLGSGQWIVTAFCLVGSALVIVKHWGNIRRLLAGTENRIGDGPMRQTLLRGLHILTLGFWFGGAAFFNFVSAPTIFDSFKQVVNGGASDRTAHQAIVPPDATQPTKDALASALAGSAVGPIFPKYFLMQALCGGIALVTALTWFRDGPGAVHRWRVYLLGAAILLVAGGWSISDHVSQLRVDRFHPDAAVAEAARAAFGPWHLVSLLLSAVTTCLAGVGLALAAKLPASEPSNSAVQPDVRSAA
ncbi:MAG TPA: glycerol-3-phosphate 1-O-acyltransferase PlsY [Fimbriiglobus sp.]|jgi:acyl-phosphate glycerol 3-phosphate acyltransferase|nr:glycerol-3-phosphate 1-O-acyltransferase PlsY [Fimbriiglobus sp.]